MLLTKTLLVAAGITGGLLASPSAAAMSGQMPEGSARIDGSNPSPSVLLLNRAGFPVAPAGPPARTGVFGGVYAVAVRVTDPRPEVPLTVSS
jgi:hypothetical protein